MEVDHFDSRRKNDVFQNYFNLVLATRHCNGAKSDRPTAKERSAGLRFLNPCEELDYGKHIFEHPDTHELVGVTPEGIYHIRCCDLNADHLVAERADRAEIIRLLREMPVTIDTKGPLAPPKEISLLMDQLTRMIPEIPLLA